MRKSLIIIIVLITMLALLFFIFKPMEIGKGYRNANNSKLVQIGMNKSEVIEIMGVPSGRVRSYLSITDSMYHYMPPFASSCGIDIQFNNDNVVNKIVYYE